MTSLRIPLVFLALLALGGCGSEGPTDPTGSDPPPLEINVSISPSTLTLVVGEEADFTATVSGAESIDDVSWQVVEGDDWGTIPVSDATHCTYLAPSIMPNPATATLRATSVEDPGSYADALISIDPEPPACPDLSGTWSIGEDYSYYPASCDGEEDGTSEYVWSISQVGCTLSFEVDGQQVELALSEGIAQGAVEFGDDGFTAITEYTLFIDEVELAEGSIVVTAIFLEGSQTPDCVRTGFLTGSRL